MVHQVVIRVTEPRVLALLIEKVVEFTVESLVGTAVVFLHKRFHLLRFVFKKSIQESAEGKKDTSPVLDRRDFSGKAG